MIEDFTQGKDTICTVIFTKIIQEVGIDFIIDFSIFGEVIDVQNHFIHLPFYAQKLKLKKILIQLLRI